jgi:hypothetical protein
MVGGRLASRRQPLIKTKAADLMPKPDPPRPDGSWTAGSRGCFHGGGDSRVRPPEPIQLKSQRESLPAPNRSEFPISEHYSNGKPR